MSRRSARPTAPRPAGCPCGLPAAYDACCGRCIRDGAAPATAEQLMRSRYSAFAVGDAAYLLASWHPATRPAEISLDPLQRWTGLEVLGGTGGGLLDTQGTVAFRAAYLRRGRAGVLDEVGAFARAGGRWRYLSPVAG